MGSRGQFALVCYRLRGADLYHERFLSSCVDGETWVVVTPDLDFYPEALVVGNDLKDVRLRPSHGVTPLGLAAAAQVYLFNPRPSRELMEAWLRQGEEVARGLRAARGVAVPEQPLCADLAVVDAPLVAVPPAPLNAGAATPIGPLVGVPPVDGLAALQAALLPGGLHSPRPAGSSDGRQQAGDARTLPLLFERDGSQYREFRSAVELSQEETIPKFVVKGPRTTAWVLRFLLENGGAPLGRHSKFKADANLNAGDPGVAMHSSLCKILQAAVTVDQLDVSNLASLELVCRELQMVEERYSDRLRTQNALVEDGDFFTMTSVGQHNVCMSPELREWISDQVRVEASVMKERRKAREERQLARSPPVVEEAKPKKHGK